MKPLAAVLIALLAVGCIPNFNRTRGNSGPGITRTAPDTAERGPVDHRADDATPSIAQP